MPDLPSPGAYPDFYILGAPKCGTTALAQYLSEHPRIFFSALKEPHFFDPEQSRRSPMDLKTYLALFKKADPSRHLAVGEGSTGYLYSNVAVARILKARPDAKFIVMLRDPVELVRSWHSHGLFSGSEKVQDFEAVWREQTALDGAVSAGTASPPDPYFLRRNYPRVGKLGDQVQRLLSQAPRERVLFLLQEDLAARPAEVYGKVLQFLGVPPDGRVSFPVVNDNKQVRWPLLHQAVHALSTLVMALKSKLRLTWSPGLLSWFLSLVSRRGKRPGISQSFQRELRDHFREDIQKLGRLIGRDLSHWEGK